MYIGMHACVSLTFSCFLSFVGVCSVSELRENRNQSFTKLNRIRLCCHLTVCNDFTQQIWHTLTLATTMSVTVEQLQLRWLCICVCKQCVCVCVCMCARRFCWIALLSTLLSIYLAGHHAVQHTRTQYGCMHTHIRCSVFSPLQQQSLSASRHKAEMRQSLSHNYAYAYVAAYSHVYNNNNSIATLVRLLVYSCFTAALLRFSICTVFAHTACFLA